MKTSNLLTYDELRSKVHYHLSLNLTTLVGTDKSRWCGFDEYFLVEELARIRNKLNSYETIYELPSLTDAFHSVVYEFESGRIFHPNSLVKVKNSKLGRIVDFANHTTVRVNFYKKNSNGKLENKPSSVNLSDLVLILNKDPLA